MTPEEARKLAPEVHAALIQGHPDSVPRGSTDLEERARLWCIERGDFFGQLDYREVAKFAEAEVAKAVSK